jgi:hypothetical protein
MPSTQIYTFGDSGEEETSSSMAGGLDSTIGPDDVSASETLTKSFRRFVDFLDFGLRSGSLNFDFRFRGFDLVKPLFPSMLSESSFKGAVGRFLSLGNFTELSSSSVSAPRPLSEMGGGVGNGKDATSSGSGGNEGDGE